MPCPGSGEVASPAVRAVSWPAMLALRSPALALALLGACLGACFTDKGAPALSAGASTGDPSIGSTAADPATTTGTSTTEISTGSTGEATTATTGEGTTAAATTGCTPVTWYFDIDKDGFGGPKSTESCVPPGPGFTIDSLDCNDSAAAINPDAVEQCDQVDNDCDGGIDEYPAGAMLACNGCQAVAGPASTYYLCSDPRDWDGARAHCMTLLGDLAIVNNADEQDFIANLLELKQRWWIGLGDGAIEGQFVWVDGSPIDPGFNVWGQEEPNNVDSDAIGAANCVVMTNIFFPNGIWQDEVCADLHIAVCEAPAAF